MDLDQQHEVIESYHLIYLSCLKETLELARSAQREGRDVSLPNLNRFFTRQWAHGLSRIPDPEQASLFDSGVASSRESLRSWRTSRGAG